MQIHLSIALNGGGAQSIAPPVYDTDALAASAAMTSEPDTARKGLLNALIAGIKADGDWAAIDWLSMIAAHHEQAGRLNLKNPTETLTAVNSPTFIIDRGFSFDSATNYLQHKVPTGVGLGFTQDSAHFGIFCTQQSVNTGARTQLGSITGSFCTLVPSTTTSGSCRINDGTNLTIPQPSPAVRTGMRVMTRENATSRKLFLNGVKVAEGGVASTGTPTVAMSIARSASSYGNDTIGAFTIGAALTEDAVARLSARITAFMTAIGAN